VLSSTANGQLQSTRIRPTAPRKYRTKQNKKTTTKGTTKQREMDKLRLFEFKHDLLKISVNLQTAFAAETHLAEGRLGW
jgi:hypothetical protein